MENQDSQKKILERKIARGSVIGMIATGFYLVSRLLMIPMILHYVSMAHYGMWSICFVILSYAGMTSFGIQNAYVKYVAQYFKQNNIRSINILLSTGLTVMGLLCTLIYAVIALASPLIIKQFNIDPDLTSLAVFMLLGTSAAFLLELWLGAFKSLLEGLQEIALTRTVWLVATLLEVALVILFLSAGYGIKGVMYAYVIKTVFEMGTHLFYAFQRLDGLKIKPMLNREPFEALFVFGGKVQGVGILSIFINTFDRVAITSLLGLEANGMFEVGRKLPFTGRSVTRAAFTPFLPAASASEHYWEKGHLPSLKEKATKYGSLFLMGVLISITCMLPYGIIILKARGLSIDNIISNPLLLTIFTSSIALVYPGIPLFKWFKNFMQKGETLFSEDIYQMYISGSRRINLINAILYSYIIAAAPLLLFAWVGPAANGIVSITIIISISSFIHVSTGLGTSILKGINRTGRELEYIVMQLSMVLILIPGCALAGGLHGAVVGTALSSAVPSLFFMWRTNRVFKIDCVYYIKKTLEPCIAPCIGAFIIGVSLRLMPDFSRLTTLVEIVASGLLYLVLTGFILKKWFLRQNEWSRLTQPIQKIINKVTL